MSLMLNAVALAGRLTRDPETRQAGDKAVCHFSLAINRRWKDANGEAKDEVTFVECESWARTAELVGQYLKKGSACYLEGRLKLDRWKDDQGVERTRMKVVANTVQFLDPRPDDTGTPINAADESGRANPGATNPRAAVARPARPAARPAPRQSPVEDDAPF